MASQGPLSPLGDRRTRPRARGRRRGLWSMVWLGMAAWWLSACLAQPRVEPLPTATPSPRPPTVTPTPTPPQDLRVWVPAPLFAETDPAWSSLQGQARAFAATTGVQVELRRRGIYGPGGMLTLLLPAQLAAPAAVPDVALIPHDLLEALVVKADLPPLPEALAQRGFAEGYTYARRAASLHGVAYGVPIGSETLVLAWPDSLEVTPPASWAEWLRMETPWVFPARDPYGWAYLALYHAAGGAWRPQPGSAPSLDPEALRRMLEFLVQAQWQGGLMADARTWMDFAELWRAHPEVMQLTWSRYPRRDLNRAWAPLPGPTGEAAPLARVYLWVILTRDGQRRALATRWVEQMSRTDWLAAWLRQLGLWPAQPPAASLGTSPAEMSYLERAAPFPRMDLLFPIGHALSLAGQRVLEGQMTPLDAIPLAQQALGPEPTPTATAPPPAATPTPSPAHDGPDG